MSAEVYFAQRRATQGGGLLEKLDQLVDAAGFGPMLAGGSVAVRVAFGEVGNTSSLRPAFARQLIRKLRHHGATPFLADTLVPGSARRAQAADHLAAAMAAGWGDVAPLLVADGLSGRDQRLLPAGPAGEAAIAAAYVEAEGLVTFTHWTGHEGQGFVGALYNLGYGAASLAGKAAILAAEDEARAAAVVASAGALLATKPRKAGFVTLLIDLVPGPDDQAWSDAAVAPDIGILASRDPVAIDQAGYDLFLQAPGLPGTRLADPASRDKLRDLFPGVDAEAILRVAEQAKLGTRDYELMII